MPRWQYLQKLCMRVLFGSYTDAILLGGGSVIALIVIEGLQLSNAHMTVLAWAMLVLANFVNHPHFAHSYQIFYGLRNSVIVENEFSSVFRRRWIWAAFVAPALIAVALLTGVICWGKGNGFWLSLCLNIMAALVGWHYVKQGFGMVMLDASLKKIYWTSKTRMALLCNAYACWLTAWLLINSYGVGSGMWGIFSLPVAIPGAVVLLACAVVSVTTAWMGLQVVRDISSRRSGGARWSELPINGVLAYLVTLYLWTLLSWVNSAFLLVIPFFHSLQYLTVVYRYASNRKKLTVESGPRYFSRFFLFGCLLGGLGFWIIPGGIDYISTGILPLKSQGIFVGVASVWIFINIHHYVIDNVLWRKENTAVNKQLLAHLENEKPGVSVMPRGVPPANAHSHIAGFTLVELMVVVAIVGLLAAIAVPQYQTYVLRSQVQRVVGEAGSLKPAVELCLQNGKAAVGNPATDGRNCDPEATGSNLQATAGNAAPTIAETWSAAGTGVPQVSLSVTSPSTIVATLGNVAGLQLQGPPAGSITWQRTLDGSWTCKAANIEAKYVSSACPL